MDTEDDLFLISQAEKDTQTMPDSSLAETSKRPAISPVSNEDKKARLQNANSLKLMVKRPGSHIDDTFFDEFKCHLATLQQ